MQNLCIYTVILHENTENLYIFQFVCDPHQNINLLIYKLLDPCIMYIM